MDLDQDVLAAIGLVVVESTNLEWMLANLVTARWGWSGDVATSMNATGGEVRRQLLKLVKADPDWEGIGAFTRRACSLLEQRNDVVHSVVVHVRGEDDELRDLELWRAKDRTSRPVPTVGELARLASDLRGCAVGAVMTLSDAEDRFDRFGATGAPTPPKTA